MGREWERVQEEGEGEEGERREVKEGRGREGEERERKKETEGGIMWRGGREQERREREGR